jgi:hypothetical protein
MVPVDEVPLAEGAPEKELDGIHTAPVGFHDGHELLVFGSLHAQVGLGGFGRAIPDGQPRADMPMELNRFLQILWILSVFCRHPSILLFKCPLRAFDMYRQLLLHIGFEEPFSPTLENTVQCQSRPASVKYEKFVFMGPANWKFL